MKFNFKIQQYQTDAVDAVVKVFNGQGYHDKIKYVRDLGKIKSKAQRYCWVLYLEKRCKPPETITL